VKIATSKPTLWALQALPYTSLFTFELAIANPASK
jgi:hypothetical protein